MPDRQDDPLPPTLPAAGIVPTPPPIPGFEILEPIAAGGMGVVYRARQVDLDRIVALKILPPAWASDPERAVRFEREARAAARLDHPAIVGIHHVGEACGACFLVLEHVEGPDLARVLAEAGGPLGVARTLEIGVEIGQALAHAHERGIVHRDVKPANILIDGRRARLVDFGVAIGLGETRITLPGAILGTPAYLPPEVLEGAGAAGPTVDVYGLGAVLYELLTGRPPFTGDRLTAICHRILTEVPPAPGQIVAGLAGDLDSIVLQCLARAPTDRYATMAALVADLEAFRDGRPVAARPARRPGPAGRLVEGLTRRLGRRGGATSAMALYCAGRDLLDAGDTDGAIDRFTMALQVNARLAEALHDRGLARERKGDGAGALEDLERALEILPGYASARVARGRVKKAAGDVAGAIDEYARALAARPDPIVYYNRALARREIGDTDGAIEDYGAALDLHPRYAMACLNRAALLEETGQLDRALADIERVLEINPGYAAAYNNRGRIRLRLDDRAEAIADFERALELGGPGWPHRATVEANLRQARG